MRDGRCCQEIKQSQEYDVDLETMLGQVFDYSNIHMIHDRE